MISKFIRVLLCLGSIIIAAIAVINAPNYSSLLPDNINFLKPKAAAAIEVMEQQRELLTEIEIVDSLEQTTAGADSLIIE